MTRILVDAEDLRRFVRFLDIGAGEFQAQARALRTSWLPEMPAVVRTVITDHVNSVAAGIDQLADAFHSHSVDLRSRAAWAELAAGGVPTPLTRVPTSHSPIPTMTTLGSPGDPKDPNGPGGPSRKDRPTIPTAEERPSSGPGTPPPGGPVNPFVATAVVGLGLYGKWGGSFVATQTSGQVAMIPDSDALPILPIAVGLSALAAEADHQRNARFNSRQIERDLSSARRTGHEGSAAPIDTLVPITGPISHPSGLHLKTQWRGGTLTDWLAQNHGDQIILWAARGAPI